MLTRRYTGPRLGRRRCFVRLAEIYQPNGFEREMESEKIYQEPSKRKKRPASRLTGKRSLQPQSVSIEPGNTLQRCSILMPTTLPFRLAISKYGGIKPPARSTEEITPIMVIGHSTPREYGPLYTVNEWEHQLDWAEVEYLPARSRREGAGCIRRRRRWLPQAKTPSILSKRW